MRRFRALLGPVFGPHPIEPDIEDVFHSTIGVKAEVKRPPAGGFQPVFAVTRFQPHQAQGRPVALFGMGPDDEQCPDHLGRRRPGLLRPAEETLRSPVEVGPMGGRHMFQAGLIREPEVEEN